MEVIGILWTEVVIRPMTNGLVFFYTILGSNFGLAIIFFTMLARVLLYPLTMRQLRSTKAMQQLQPRIKEMQEKYKNDKARQQKEQMALFKEAGVNPIGCLGPIIIQLPIWIGLFYAIRNTLADTPETLVGLSGQLYSWLPRVNEAVPLNSSFLWMDLGKPDPSPIIMPLLVGGSMYVVQKMSTVPNSDPRQSSITSMMNWMWPLMFGIWTLAFPSGLAVYWVVSNLVSIVLQYRVTGWGGLARQPKPVPVPTPAAVAERPAKTKRELAPAASQVLKNAPPAAPPPSSVIGYFKRMFGSQPGARAPTQPPAPPAAPPPSGVVGYFKRVFFGSQPAARAPTQPPADGAAKPDPAAQAVAASTSVKEGDAHADARNDRQDGRRSYRQSDPTARRQPRRRRNRRPR